MNQLPIERDLREALAVGPPPEFAAGVRARIAAKSERQFGLWTWTSIAASAVAAVALAIALWPTRGPNAAPRPQFLAARSVVAVATLPAVTPSVVRRKAPAVRPPEPAILISPSESRALLNLIADIRSGRVDPATLPAEPKVTDIAIEPIAIEPLPSIDGGQGVRQ